MHFYFYLRAILQDEEQFIKNLESQYFSFSFLHPETKKMVNGGVQLGVRRWAGFYEIVFPEQCYDEVMTMMGRIDTHPDNLQYNTFMAFLRKMTGSTKLKPVKEGLYQRPTWRTTHPDIRLYAIGIKKDVYKDGVEQL